MKVAEYIGSQFGNPRGMVGQICCICMNIFNRRLYDRVCDAILRHGCNRVLDIGFGNGHLEKRLSRQSQLYVNGIDISQDMLESASKRNHSAIEQGRMNLSIGDCCDLAFEDGTFDAVASVNTIYFWKDTAKGLMEIRRVLKENGIFVNAVYTEEWMKRVSYTKKGFHFFSKEDYIADGRKAGFSQVVIQDIVKGKSFLIRYSK